MKAFKTPLLAACLLSAAPAVAGNFSFVGTFDQDDNVQLFNFVVGAASNVTLRSWGYAGGVNAAGTTIAQGGFDTILALFDSTGAFIDQNDDGGCSLVAADAETGVCYDTFLTAALGAGSYTVAVMQYNNFALGPNLSNGFVRSGQGNFTTEFGCSENQPAFNDVTDGAGCGRSNAWAFDILNVEDAVAPPRAVPEPASWALMISGLGLAGGLMRRRARVRYAAA